MKLSEDQILPVLQEAFLNLSKQDLGVKSGSPEFTLETRLDDLGITEANIHQLSEELRMRLGGVAINVELLWRMQQQNRFQTHSSNAYDTLGAMVKHIKSNLGHGIVEPTIVYVDDEEENLFVFRRRYGKTLKLKTFNDPYKALEFIKEEPHVALVLTDEFMPGMSGNDLCDAVHSLKPRMKFILITGNPAGDENLLHKTLRHGRFQDFFNKPLNFDTKGDEYLQSIKDCLEDAYL